MSDVENRSSLVSFGAAAGAAGGDVVCLSPQAAAASAPLPAATMSAKYWTSLYIVWCAFFFDAVVLTVAIPVLPTFLAKINVSQTAIGALFATKVR